MEPVSVLFELRKPPRIRRQIMSLLLTKDHFSYFRKTPRLAVILVFFLKNFQVSGLPLSLSRYI